MKIPFIVTLVCILAVGCTKSQIKKNACTGEKGFVELDSCSIFFNNLFTPNADGINDRFPNYCDCPGSEEFLLTIKNGNKVLFETSNPNDDLWDGTLNGKPVREGVYDFSFHAKLGNFNPSLTGTITLIRDISKPIKINSTDCVYNFFDPIVIEH